MWGYILLIVSYRLKTRKSFIFYLLILKTDFQIVSQSYFYDYHVFSIVFPLFSYFIHPKCS